MWVQPELNKRKDAGRLPPEFRIRSCLIRLPKGRQPVVEFNEEVSFQAKVKVPPLERPIQAGKEIYLWDIEKIEAIEPPLFEGERVGFVYLLFVGEQWRVFFDFGANNTCFSDEQKREWHFSESLAAAIQGTVVEMAVRLHDALQTELLRIGLWAVPSLIPYPLSRIASLVKEGDESGARALLIQRCTPDWLVDRVATWWPCTPFADRRALIEQSLAAHRAGHYCLTVSTLLPHVEGVMTDWVHMHEPGAPFRQESKTKKFRELATADPQKTHLYRRVVDSAIDFILQGPVLATFKQWFDNFDTTFANRHVVGHGRYDERLYTEENSIKVFLMLDTIHQIIIENAPKTDA